MQYSFSMLPGEHWWGGNVIDGDLMPYDEKTDLCVSFSDEEKGNQGASLFLSDKGRVLFSEHSFVCRIHHGAFEIESPYEVTMATCGQTLKEAYLGACRACIPARGAELPDTFFRVPQYNTWMQFTYRPTQEKVLQYAHDIVKNGFAPGILTIDEGWQQFYGKWDFDRTIFPDPAGMIRELHALGFRVMLWVVPYVRADGKEYLDRVRQDLNPKEYDKSFLRTSDGRVALMEWWNGFSAMLDMTKQEDRAFLDAQLQRLMDEYGVDGFKFDGGGTVAYVPHHVENGTLPADKTPEVLNAAWFAFGLRYAFHEYKDVFNGGGIRSVQRIRDRGHRWDGDGLSSLLPTAIAQGLIGFPFLCPDMVGGGEWTYRDLHVPVDEELFVRMAQCSALFPMMQFSWAPWEAVDETHLDMIRQAARRHTDMADTILSLVADAYRTGEPILRALEYNYPHAGLHAVHDTFMLGENILVSPVLQKGQTTKVVPLPVGRWKAEDGTVYEGGSTVTVPAPLDTLPVFYKLT